ncbi:hypothetical protein EJ05DRAFT_143626 [Pseudovirgaria hyperparasitica]|uniref:Rrn6 domain-containing protein n=1 Tax=Pseudovirgaria hyperparasitica TaxID=470096 RepID=A0A6A6VXY8_9PEZI|nr:uncharacterized protein EJ05DRAFT_143626 [Pseudovirgaria hyperparasitica]KAF2754510.1 hypothetical protein EJ05DRAFT_143626 [Pseudovirgaria hyperparasitica]
MAETTSSCRKAYQHQDDITESRKLTRADAAPLSVGYGYTGVPSYQVTTGKFSFSRLPGHQRSLRMLGPFLSKDLQLELASRDEEIRHEETVPPYQWASRRHGHAVKALYREVPNLDFDMSLMQELLQESEAVTEVQDVYDPLYGDLFCFGQAIDTTVQCGSSSICVVPGERTGAGLKIKRLVNTVHGWNFDHSTGLLLSSPQRHIGHWQGPGARILQVCDSEVQEGMEDFVAVRLPSVIYLLRPVYERSTPFPSHMNRSYSSLHPNHILTISKKDIEESAFADVTFNPWYKRQLAVVSQTGSWRIFEISGTQRHKRSTYTTSIVRQGSFQHSSKLTTRGDDGWYRVLWICNSNVIVVCARREINFYNISTLPLRLGRPNLGLDHSSEWILDMRRVPGQRNHLAILTTTHLLLIDAGHLAETMNADGEILTASNITSWKLWRDRDDITLRMSMAADHDGSILAVIYSRLNLLITNIRFEISEVAGSARSLSDPCHLDLGQVTTRNIVSAKIALTNFASVDGAMEKSEEDHDYVDKSFFQLFVVHDDYSMESFVFFSSSSNASRHDGLVEPFDWIKPWSRQAQVSQKHVDDIMEDTMEGLSDFHLGHDNTDYDVPEPIHPPDFGSGFHDIYKFSVRQQDDDTSPLIPSLDRVRSNLEDSHTDDMSADLSRTLYEIIGPTTMVADTSTASSAFWDFCRTEVTNLEPDIPKYGIRPIISNTHIGLEMIQPIDDDDQEGRAQDLTISAVYRHATKHWLGGLNPDTSRHFRRSREHIIRRAAVDIALSLHNIQAIPTHPSASQSQDLPNAATQSQTVPGSLFTIPIRSSDKGKAPMSSRPDSQASSVPLSSHSQSRGTQSHQLPTPEPTPSLTSASFSTSYVSSGPLHLNALRDHARVSKPTIILSGPVARTCSHWAFGEDPSHYDYEATIRELAAQVETELAPKARRKMERRMKKRLREERLENASNQAAQQIGRITLSQPTPRVEHGSSPGPSHGALPGSSQPITASQIEFGKFGARPKKKRKLRQSGF